MAGLADMMRAIGRGNGRREGMVTTGASSVRHERNRAPAVRAKMGVGIISQKRVTIRAMIGKKKPERPTHETRHRFCDMIDHRQPLIRLPTSLYGEEPAGVKVVRFRFIMLYE